MFVFILALISSTAFANLPADYEQKTSCQKQKFLWEERLAPTQYKELPMWSALDILRSTALLDLGVTLNRQSDELPKGRKKIFHPLGSVVALNFVPDFRSPYTGLWRGDCAIARLSLGADPSLAGYLPGIALKFFIKGQPSVNIQLLHSLDAQSSKNFFEQNLTNELPSPKNILFSAVVKLFSLTGVNPLKLSVQRFGAVNIRGAEVSSPKSPDLIVLEPTVAAKYVAMPIGNEDFRESLARILPGTILYDVYGVDSEIEPNNSSKDRKLMGHLVTTTQVVASQYGDENLFFKHEGTKKVK